MSQKIILIVDCIVSPSLLKINSMIYIYTGVRPVDLKIYLHL